MRLRSTPLSLALALALPAMPLTAAASDGTGIFSFSGFGTVGVVHNSEDLADFATNSSPEGAGYTSSWSTLPDTRVAAQVDAKFTEKLSAVVQVMSEFNVDRNYDPQVELAHVKYAFTPALALRVGRYTAPMFMLSEYRKVGYAMPWVRPPSEVYNLAISLDGADLTYKFSLGDTAMTVQAIAGDADETVYKLHNSLGVNLRAEFGSSTVFAGYNTTRVDLVNPGLATLLGYYQPHFPAITEQFHVKDNEVTFASLGYAYDPGTWFTRAEVTRTAGKDDLVTHTTNSYITAGRRMGAFTPYATYARVDMDSPVTIGAADPIGAVNAVLAANNRQRQSLTVGTRWDVRDSVALKLEAAHVDADTGSNGGLTNLQPGFQRGGSYNLLSASVDFVF